MYNRIPIVQSKGKKNRKTNLIGHSLKNALRHAKKLDFELDLGDHAINFIHYLDDFGSYRYLGKSYYLNGPKLLELDHTVWKLRRYCFQMRKVMIDEEGNSIDLMPVYLEKIHRSNNEHYINYKIRNGVLEDILSGKSHIPKDALINENEYFNIEEIEAVYHPQFSTSVNTPLSLHLAIVDKINELTYLPFQVFDFHKKKLAKKSKEQG